MTTSTARGVSSSGIAEIARASGPRGARVMIGRLVRRLGSTHGRQRLRLAFARRINRWLRPLGFSLIAHHFYQPIPSDEELAVYDERERPVSQIDWHLDEQVELVSDLLRTYAGEYNDPECFARYGLDVATSQLGPGDREVLYAWIRRYKPSHVVEVGAGGSTSVIAAALAANHLEGGGVPRFTTIEPYPTSRVHEVGQRLGGEVEFELIEEPLQSTPLELFTSLKPQDLVFIDSSHVFKQGSDVEYQFLRLYPSLPRGVFVHVHDIFSPYDYPLVWNQKRSRFWNEQYFLEVMLLNNPNLRVMACLSLLGRRKPEVFASVESFSAEILPGSFWMCNE